MHCFGTTGHHPLQKGGSRPPFPAPGRRNIPSLPGASLSTGSHPGPGSEINKLPQVQDRSARETFLPQAKAPEYPSAYYSARYPVGLHRREDDRGGNPPFSGAPRYPENTPHPEIALMVFSTLIECTMPEILRHQEFFPCRYCRHHGISRYFLQTSEMEKPRTGISADVLANTQSIFRSGAFGKIPRLFLHRGTDESIRTLLRSPPSQMHLPRTIVPGNQPRHPRNGQTFVPERSASVIQDHFPEMPARLLRK